MFKAKRLLAPPTDGFLSGAHRWHAWIFLPLLLCCLSVSSAVLAQTGHDVLLVLDNSGSMKTNDPQFLTRQAVEAFVTAQEPGMRIGMVIFGEKVKLVLPLSTLSDASDPALQAALAELDYSGQWTNTADALERGIYELKTQGREDAILSMVLMTDGIVDTGNKAVDREKVEWMRTTLVKQAKREKIRIYGVAVTEIADFQLMQTLALETDGDYYRILDVQDMAATFTALLKSLLTPEAEPIPEPPVPETAIPATPTDADSSLEYAPSAVPEKNGDTLADRLPTATQPEPAPAQAPVLANNTFVYLGLALLIVLLGVVILLMVRGRSSQTGEKVFKAILVDLYNATGSPKIGLTGGLYIIGRVGKGGEEGAHYIVVRDSKISRRHAVIRFHDAGYWITDQGGKNGTLVNEEKVEKERLLKHGDIVRCSVYEFRYEIPGFEQADETQFGGSAFPASTVMAPASASAPTSAMDRQAPTQETHLSPTADRQDTTVMWGSGTVPVASPQEAEAHDPDRTLVRNEEQGQTKNGLPLPVREENPSANAKTKHEEDEFDFSGLESDDVDSIFLDEPDDKN